MSVNLQSMSPINNIASVTPHDTNDFTNNGRAIFVGTAGALKVDTVGGDTVTLPATLQAGVWHPIAVKRVYATGTAATDIFIGY